MRQLKPFFAFFKWILIFKNMQNENMIIVEEKDGWQNFKFSE